MRIFVFIIALFIAANAFADTLSFPSNFDLDIKKFKENLEKSGKVIDKDPYERTEKSWGFLNFNGKEWTLVTYRRATDEDLDLITKAWRESISG